MIDIEQLRAVLAKATPRPWEHGEAMCCPDLGWVCGVVKSVYSGAGKSTHSMRIEDAEAIAAIMNAAGPLLAELAAAREAYRAARDLLLFLPIELASHHYVHALSIALTEYAAALDATPAPGKEL